VLFGPLKLVAKIVGAFLGLTVFYLAVTFVQIWLTGHEHATVKAQAILVFGTAQIDGAPSPELQARLDQALVLWRNQRAPLVVVTGGNRPGDHFTEAGVSARYLAQHGVRQSAILRGGGSDTWENVASVAAVLHRRGIHTLLTVSDPFHEYRAMSITSDWGFRPKPSPVSQSPTSGPSLWRYYLKETLEVAVGRFVGYRTLSSWTSTSHLVTSLTVPFGK
jgi:uncharacterized SAM-binding protein YcdF (DUF218 family)